MSVLESLRLQYMEWSHVKEKISMHTGDLKVKFYQGSISSMDNAFFWKYVALCYSACL